MRPANVAMKLLLHGDVCSIAVLTQLSAKSHKRVLFCMKVASYGAADVCSTVRGVRVAFWEQELLPCTASISFMKTNVPSTCRVSNHQ